MPAASARRAATRPIRWDRVGRCALLAVFVGIVVLYIGPATSLVRAIGQSKSRNAEVDRLQRIVALLQARVLAALLAHPRLQLARLAQATLAPPQLRLQGHEDQQQEGEDPPAAQGRGLSA